MENKGKISMTAIPVHVFKSGICDYMKKASDGLEIVAENKHNPRKVSLVDTEILTAALDALKFDIIKTYDESLRVYTYALNDFPPYGEGETEDEAIESLIDAVIDYCDAYIYRADIYRKMDSSINRAYMLKLIRCAEDRKALRQALGL